MFKKMMHFWGEERSLTTLLVLLAVSPVLSQDKPADNMQILRDKIKADKKLVVAANMELTESEAKGFWPVYEEYQKDLSALNRRIYKAGREDFTTCFTGGAEIGLFYLVLCAQNAAGRDKSSSKGIMNENIAKRRLPG